MLKKTTLVLGIVLLGGLGGIFANQYLFPHLAANDFFSRYDLFKKSIENVTVINKTEQVYIKEETSLDKITGQISSAMVNILSYSATPGGSFKNGTGEIVTSDGIIMTHEAALLLSSKYKVFSFDGKVYEAELLGVDSWSGLAFLKINASNLPVASFADSDEFGAGKKVIAISNDSLEYQNTLNSGIIKSFDYFYNISGQSLSMAEKLEGVFLTDFKTEKFSPGSPIINYSGQIVGITGVTIKNNQTEYFEIPANKVKKVLHKVINKKINIHPSLGAYFIPLNKSYALANNLSAERGALIFSPSGQNGLAIIAGSNAQKAGLKINDIILKVDADEITLQNNLSDILYQRQKGDRVEFTILRDKKEIKIEVGL